MKYISIMGLLIITSCSTKEVNFSIVNPKVEINELWVKHKNLPQFDTKLHSDGCSGGMSAIYSQLTFLHNKHGKTLQWRKCCEVHDKSYYYGGSKIDKKNADVELNQCVSKVIGNKFLGQAMQITVELGGGPYLPTSYRWGYGTDFKK